MFLDRFLDGIHTWVLLAGKVASITHPHQLMRAVDDLGRNHVVVHAYRGGARRRCGACAFLVHAAASPASEAFFPPAAVATQLGAALVSIRTGTRELAKLREAGFSTTLKHGAPLPVLLRDPLTRRACGMAEVRIRLCVHR